MITLRHKAVLAILQIVLSIHIANVQAAVCNTNQNPYCAGNSAFEQICCNYPDVCYWSDRQGTPACCPYGQACIEGNDPSPSEPSQPTTASVVVVTTTPRPSGTSILSTITTDGTPTSTIYSTITTTRTHSMQSSAPAEQSTITITSSETGFIEGVTSTIAGAASTAVNVIFGDDGSRLIPETLCVVVVSFAILFIVS